MKFDIVFKYKRANCQVGNRCESLELGKELRSGCVHASAFGNCQHGDGVSNLGIDETA